MLQLRKNHVFNDPVIRLNETQLGRVIAELCPTKVIWAVDVENDTTSNISIENLIEEISNNSRVVIEPVYVLLPDNSSISEMLLLKRREDLVYRKVEQLKLALGPHLSVQSPRVLNRLHDMQASAVDLILEYANGVEADLLIAKSSKRYPFMRALSAGFTDELLSKSKVPVVLFKEGDQPGSLPASLHLPVENEGGEK